MRQGNPCLLPPPLQPVPCGPCGHRLYCDDPWLPDQPLGLLWALEAYGSHDLLHHEAGRGGEVS